MGSRGTFVLQRIQSVAFKLFAAIDLHSVNCGRVAANWSAGHATEFENIGRNVVVVSKSGPVETGPTVLVATALECGLMFGTILFQYSLCLRSVLIVFEFLTIHPVFKSLSLIVCDHSSISHLSAILCHHSHTDLSSQY